MIGDHAVTLGPWTSYQLLHSPRRILFALSYYKFAAKLLGTGKRVLEVGCSEGLGALLLGESAAEVVGVDIDEEAIHAANATFASDKVKFIAGDLLESDLGTFDGVVSFDVIEHIYPEHETAFLQAMCRHLEPSGMCVIGTPNKTAEQYASEVARRGHVNLYSADRLRSTMETYFETTLLFSANDETVHTGFYPMAHYLIAVGCHRRA